MLVTTKAPTWHDPLVLWRDFAPTVGALNEGFFYPDPLGFWAEARRWVHLLVGLEVPGISMGEALAVASLIHVGDDVHRIERARAVSRPRVVLFLDEPSWQAAGLAVESTIFQIPDPHRPGQVYEGFWGHGADGTVVGKSPQHPSTHRLYRRADLDEFLRHAPLGVADPASAAAN